MSGVATPSAPIAGSAYVLATMMSMCAVMLATKSYMLEGKCQLIATYYGPSLSLSDRSVHMYIVCSFKNKLN